MPFSIAGGAYFRTAAATLAIFAASCNVGVNIAGLDPIAAAFGRAVYAVFRGILLVFLIPFLLKAYVEEFIDMFERDVVLCATFGGHMLRVGDGQVKNSAKTGVAHGMLACEFGRFGDRNI